METGGEELSLLSLEREDGVYVPSSRACDSAHRISADLPYDDLSGVSLATCWLSSSVKIGTENILLRQYTPHDSAKGGVDGQLTQPRNGHHAHAFWQLTNE